MPSHYPALLIDIARLSVWLLVLVILFIPLERLFAAQPHALFRKGMFTDLCYYFLNSLVPAMILSVPIGFLAWAAHWFVPGTVLAATAALPFWGRALAGFVVGEVGYYWAHRMSHEIPFLWRFHSIHHSAENMDFLVATRAHPFDMVFSKFCGLVPMYLLGLGGPMHLQGSLVPVLVMLIGTIWGFFIHANLRWRFGPLEMLVSTPGFHHWHHTRSGPINRNYSSNFPWIDSIFGSLYLPKDWPSDYGSRTHVPEVLVDQFVFPFFRDEATQDDADVAAPEEVLESDPSPVGSTASLISENAAIR